MGTSDPHRYTKTFVERWCRRNNFHVDQVSWDTASLPNRKYNCMGFAIGVQKWIEPPAYDEMGLLFNPDSKWPDYISKDTDIDAFIAAAVSYGFEVVESPDWEEGYDKITLYYKTFGGKSFGHAARHVAPNLWESKVGRGSDIPHPPRAFDNIPHYGDGRVHMRRVSRSVQ
jgi:hypothetical protein